MKVIFWMTIVRNTNLTIDLWINITWARVNQINTVSANFNKARPSLILNN